MKFRDLGIHDSILKALEEKKYHTPTPIQEKAIPIVLNRKDLLGVAQTGTGKTAAFSIPIIQQILKFEKDLNSRPKLRALIVTPTRELAIQIDDNIKAYSKFTQLKHTVIFGGVKQGKQVKRLKDGIHILVATPGRLLDLQGQGFINFNDLKLFVLDEADRMLDMGFIHDIKRLLKLLPSKKQSLFFSATMPENIVQLSKSILSNPEKVEITPASSTAEKVDQEIYYTNRTTKRDMLLHILKDKLDDQVLLFSRTKHGADKIVRYLRKENIKAVAIHGNKSQNQRQAALKDFKKGKVKIMVATDIASRGIDIDKLKYVINYNIPNVPEDYVHRIGRTGRAGESGKAISICEPEENLNVNQIKKLIGDKIKSIDAHPFPQTEKPMTEKERKEFNKQKEIKKREMIALRRAQKQGKNQKSSKRKKSEDKANSSEKSQTKNKNRNKRKPSDQASDKNKNRNKQKSSDQAQKRNQKKRSNKPLFKHKDRSYLDLLD